MKKYFCYLLVLVPIFFIFSFALSSYYKNNIKPRMEGYQIVNNNKTQELIKYKGKKLPRDLMMFVHYYTGITNDKREYHISVIENLNDIYFDCIQDDNIFNISCMNKYYNKKTPLLIDDSCSWTFFGYLPIAKYKNYYLVNIEEKLCGTFLGRYNSYYIFEYINEKLKLISVNYDYKDLNKPIKFFKIENDSFKFVTEKCAHASDTCIEQEADWYELSFL